jgi:hypothetical protein
MIYWTLAAVLGFGLVFLGWAWSWPVPNEITLGMMAIGLTAFIAATYSAIKAFRAARNSN